MLLDTVVVHIRYSIMFHCKNSLLYFSVILLINIWAVSLGVKILS